MNQKNDQIKLAMVGHVDTGKSTTLGNLLYLTGNVTEHEMDKTRKEAENNGKKKFCYAYLLDIDNEERMRGITQSYNIIDFNYNQKEYKLIDTPGHKLYIKEMIEALSTNNDTTVCIVVSCVDNEFNSSMNGGTTKEDILLIRGCDIQNIVILINKVDLLYDENNKQKLIDGYNNVVDQLNPFIKKLGFKSVTYLPISGYEGWNLVKPNEKINDILKPKFNTLIDIVDNYNDLSKNNNIINKSIKKSKDKIKVQLNILNLDKIITVGYKFVLHIVDIYEETEIIGEVVLINSLKNEKQLYINNNDKVYVGLKLNKSIDVYNNQRIIFRNSDSTVGFGKIMVDINK
jgi:small GTP-binding protein